MSGYQIRLAQDKLTIDPSRYLVIYADGRTSRQICLDDVFTHIKLRRQSANSLPIAVERFGPTWYTPECKVRVRHKDNTTSPQAVCVNGDACRRAGRCIKGT